MTEEWRPVVGYEGVYEVSSQGIVRSLSRMVRRGNYGDMRPVPETLLTVFVHLTYPTVFIAKKTVYTHKLVCEAWHGPRPEGMQCRHLDGDPLNCTPENLRWGTPKENSADTLRHGHHANLSKTYCSNGHAYSERNTYRATQGHRVCRVCNRAAVARYNARKAGVR